MISSDEYIQIVNDVLNIDINENLGQKEAILAPLNEDQYIVAGPGSGKTTVLVLKILKFVLVDGIDFNKILITTFTKKAAKEIEDRVVDWYSKLIGKLNLESTLDLNKFFVGTLDSMAEEIVSEYIDTEIIDNFTSSAIMMQNLLTDERNKDKRLKQFVKKINGTQGVSASDINNLIQTIRERSYYDIVDRKSLKDNANREKIIFDILDDYNNQLDFKNVMDYAMLEEKFYEILSKETVSRFEDVSVLLVDEYQDTNLLQEQIYFKITEYVKQNKGNVSIVGDDDQSLYRFRGATISLFTDYPNRINNKLNITPKTVFLKENYRSTQSIINFSNEFITLDDKYQKSRSFNKPLMEATENTELGLPIMGMFRNDVKELASDLSKLLYDLKTNNEYEVIRYGESYNISVNKDNPSIAVLTNSPKEINANNNKRLPYYIRESLSIIDSDITVFNPRGQAIETTEMVSMICGLILLIIDPDSQMEEQLENLPPRTTKTLEQWRTFANEYVLSHDITLHVMTEPIDLIRILEEDIKHDANLLKLDSSENEIYYDIIMEAIRQTTNAISDEDGLLTINQILWHILVPVASGAIEIDEEMFTFDLENNINIMSIHQSKGLEFDVVIVDVGSDIFSNSSTTAFKRFPKKGGRSFNLENYLKDFSKIDEEYYEITGLDKEFNDLIRRYFVAYTRAKTILILVGLNSMRYGSRGDFQKNILIENVATGWTRDKVWHWDSLDNLLQI